MDNLIEDYIDRHTSEEPTHLHQLYRYTHLHHLYPRMCSGHAQGRLLKLLTEMIRPRYVLELGTYTGYSALCISEGMNPEGELHTIEIDDEVADELTDRFAEMPGGERIHLHVGDAMEIIPTIDRTWDMVFIDANKRHYTEYFNLVWPRVRPGGFILADNTLWDGKVTDENVTDSQTESIRRFNDMVAAHPDVETTILPIRDGLTIIHKKI